MCGIVGVLGKPSNNMTNLFLDMLHVDVVRGDDSTGAVAVKRDLSCVYYKDEVKPWELVSQKGFRKVFNTSSHDPENICYMGHNRAATKGKVNRDNAHPFNHNGVVLTHNGTIHNAHELPRPEKTWFDTDSEAITWALGKEGPQEVYKTIRGAATLAWWDLRDNTLNLLSNGKRPLHFIYSRDQSTLIYASEDWMIENFAHRRGIFISPKKMFEPSPDFWFKFSYDEKTNKVSHEVEELQPPLVVVPAKKLPVVVQNGRNTNHGGAGANNDDSRLTFAFEDLDKPASERTPHGLNYREFSKNYKKCMFCDSNLIDRFEEAVVVSDDEAVCIDCATVASEFKMPLNNYRV